jgi:hypothetical protein
LTIFQPCSLDIGPAVGHGNLLIVGALIHCAFIEPMRARNFANGSGRGRDRLRRHNDWCIPPGSRAQSEWEGARVCLTLGGRKRCVLCSERRGCDQAGDRADWLPLVDYCARWNMAPDS